MMVTVSDGDSGNGTSVTAAATAAATSSSTVTAAKTAATARTTISFPFAALAPRATAATPQQPQAPFYGHGDPFSRYASRADHRASPTYDQYSRSRQSLSPRSFTAHVMMTTSTVVVAPWTE
jgi:hypothetical protein